MRGTWKTESSGGVVAFAVLALAAAVAAVAWAVAQIMWVLVAAFPLAAAVIFWLAVRQLRPARGEKPLEYPRNWPVVTSARPAAIEPPREVHNHMHFHGTRAADVAAILNRQRED